MSEKFRVTKIVTAKFIQIIDAEDTKEAINATDYNDWEFLEQDEDIYAVSESIYEVSE